MGNAQLPHAIDIGQPRREKGTLGTQMWQGFGALGVCGRGRREAKADVSVWALSRDGYLRMASWRRHSASTRAARG